MIASAMNPGSSLEAAALIAIREEFDFLDELAPLMGGTARSVKRFVDLCQLPS